MTDEETAKIRQQAIEDQQSLVDALAPYYLGKTCPLQGGRECTGPRCSVYTVLNDNPQKPNVVTGGVCGIPLGVHQLLQLNGQIEVLAKQMGNFALSQGTRILGAS